MQKPLVFNRHLKDKWAEKENNFMISKLTQVKAKVDQRCPESYTFYQTQFRKTQTRNNRIKEYEIEKDNQILFEKIMGIITSSPVKKLSKRKPKFEYKQNLFSNCRKYDYIKITQENQHLIKRLNDRQSFYNTKAWEKDYEKSQNYKKNLCVFPSIDFHKTSMENTKKKKFENTQYSLFGRIKNIKIDNTQNNFHKTSGEFYPNEDHKDNGEKKLLFTKMVFLGELSHCQVSFSVHNKHFMIEVEQSNTGNQFVILFEDVEEIAKIQSLYKKYEQIIIDLEYDMINERLFINNLGNVNLNYKSYVMKKDFKEETNSKKSEDKFNIDIDKAEIDIIPGNKTRNSNREDVPLDKNDFHEEELQTFNEKHFLHSQSLCDEERNPELNKTGKEEKRVSIKEPKDNTENEENTDREYITYTKAKESSKTLSRGSLRSNNLNLKFDPNDKEIQEGNDSELSEGEKSIEE